MSTRVSVVIPCYNCAGTIDRTLASIFAQSVAPDEIVAVNDGSKDDTEKVLSRYAGRVVVESQKNSGVSATRNRGVAKAKGDWIAFCDSDDLWHPHKLEILRGAHATLPESAFLFHDFTMVRDGVTLAERSTESRQHSLFPIFRRSKLTMAEMLEDHRTVEFETAIEGLRSVATYSGNALYWLILGNFLQPSTVTIRRDVFIEHGGFDEEFRHAEDTEFFLRLSKTVDYTYVDLPLMTYQARSESLLATSMLPTIINGTRALVRHCVEDRSVYDRYPDRIRKAAARKYARQGYFHLTELQTKQARENAREAMRYDALDRHAWSVYVAGLLPRPFLKLLRSAKTAAGKRRGA